MLKQKQLPEQKIEQKIKKEQEESTKFFKKVLFEAETAEQAVNDVLQVFFKKDIFIEFRIPKLNWQKIISDGTYEFAKKHLHIDLKKHPDKHKFIIKWFKKKRNLLLWAKLKLIAKIKLLRILFNGKEPKITVVSKGRKSHSKQTQNKKKEEKENENEGGR